jgi:tetratricopeptide (TPR) repeat protein
MSDTLTRFLLQEYDRARRRDDQPIDHPDENVWALLADGLLSAAQRDELLAHAQTCPHCRQRMSGTVSEWDDDVMISGPDAEHRVATPLVLTIYRHPVQYAAAACVLVAVGLGLYWGYSRHEERAGFGVDASAFLAAGAPLTELGVDLARRTTRSDVAATITERRYRAVLEQLAEPLAAPSPPVEALTLAARAALSAHFFDDASAYARRWAACTPDDPAAHNALGLAAYRQNRFAEALAAFERAVALSPEIAAYRLNAALAADEADEIERAVEHLRRLRELAPEHPQADALERWLRQLNP